MSTVEKKGRGRPKGAKNKDKESKPEVSTPNENAEVTLPQGR